VNIEALVSPGAYNLITTEDKTMKKTIITMLAVAMVAGTVPAFAMEHMHDGSEKTVNEQHAKECDTLLRNCAMEVDSIQEQINKLKAAINEKGADAYTVDELRILNNKLKEANETLRALTKPGR
jgi:peptidoglycan hydrolase CwlO-like protein